jgi:hypothetical protein
MDYSPRRLARYEMDRAAIVHRTSFDERLPSLAGLHTPAEDRHAVKETDGSCNEEREPDVLYRWQR